MKLIFNRLSTIINTFFKKPYFGFIQGHYYLSKKDLQSVRKLIGRTNSVEIEKFELNFTKAIGDGKNSNTTTQPLEVRTIRLLFVWTVLFCRLTLTGNLKQKLLTKVMVFMRHTGHSYPVELMVFKSLKYKYFSLKVHVDHEECLKFTYGEKWHTPQKQYIWHQ